MAIRDKLKVNTKLLPVKATYFFILGGVASLLPYLAVYMKQIGLSASESSIIYGTMPFLGAFVRVAAGAIADRLHKHKVTLTVCCLLSGVFHGCLLLVPQRMDISSASLNVTSQVKCGATASDISWSVCRTKLNSSSCSNTDLNGTSFISRVADQEVTETCSLTCCSADLCLWNNESSLCLLNLSCVELTVGSFRPTSIVDSDDSLCYEYTSDNVVFNDSTYGSVSCPSGGSPECLFTCTGDMQYNYLHVACLDDDPQQPSPGSKQFDRIFWMFFLICLIGQMFFNPIFSLIDAMTYNYLGDDHGKWGNQRMWGSVGFGVFAVISGLTMDIYESGSGEKNYSFAFIAFAVLNILASVMVCLYKISSNFACKQVFSNMFSLITNIEVMVLMFSMFLYGVYTGVIETFLYWHLSILGGEQLLFGLCMLVNCIPEIVVLFTAGAIIMRLGHENCLLIAFMCYGVRLLAYSFLINPWYVLIIEPLQAVCFGLMYAAASSYGSRYTPQGMHGTVQGLIGALYFGIGKGVGSIVGGQVFEKYQGVITFRAFGVSGLIFGLLYGLVYLLVLRPRNQKAEAEAAQKVNDETQEEEVKMIDNSCEKTDHKNGNGRPAADDPV